jgi:hypothetical protein
LRELDVLRFADDFVFVFDREPADLVFEREPADFVFEREPVDFLRAPDDFVFVFERDVDDFFRAPDDFVLVFEREPADFVFERDEDDFVLVFERDADDFFRPPDDFVFVFERDEVFFFRAPDLREADVLRDDDRRAGDRPRPPAPDCEPSSDESSSSEPISFFATPTAAGIATPRAVPATTLVVVDSPSSSSFDIFTSRSCGREQCPTSRR